MSRIVCADCQEEGRDGCFWCIRKSTRLQDAVKTAPLKSPLPYGIRRLLGQTLLDLEPAKWWGRFVREIEAIGGIVGAVKPDGDVDIRVPSNRIDDCKRICQKYADPATGKLNPGKAAHDLIKTGDPDSYPQIQDRNGEVVLAYCRRCRQGEGELQTVCPGARDAKPK